MAKKKNYVRAVNQKPVIETFCEIRNETETSADLYFYGDIVSSWWGAWDNTDQYPEAIRDFLNTVKGKELNIYINSAGGNVFAGIAIYNMLKRHACHKTVHVDGVAASISSVIAFAGDEIIVPSNAFLMIHKPWSHVAGNANDLRKLADDLDVLETGIIKVYEENLAEGVAIEDIITLVNEETWLNGEEAAKYFGITLAEENQVAASMSDSYKDYIHVPEVIKNQMKQVNTMPDDKALKNQETDRAVDIALGILELECLI